MKGDWLSGFAHSDNNSLYLLDHELTARFSGLAATPAKLVDQVHPPILNETFR